MRDLCLGQVILKYEVTQVRSTCCILHGSIRVTNDVAYCTEEASARPSLLSGPIRVELPLRRHAVC